MKWILIFLSCLLACAAFGQTGQAISLIGAVDYTDRVLINTSNEQIIKNIFQKRQAESGKRNYQIGILYRRQLNDRVWLNTGLKLVSIGYKDRKFEDLLWPSEVNQSGFYTFDPSLPHESQFHYDYWMITVPIRARYYFSDKKLVPYIETGLGVAYYSATRETETTDIYKLSDFFIVDAFRKINLSMELGIGLRWMAAKDFSFHIQPTTRYYFTRLVAGAPIKEYLYAFGVEFGVSKHFGKTSVTEK